MDLCDRITCHVLPEPGIELDGAEPALRANGNLAVQAAEKFAARCGRESALKITIEKSIPVGAGLGGGSSDAATTLRLCNRLWDTCFNPGQLANIGAEVGSDVSLFFSLPSAIMTGRGEQITSVTLRWSGWVLLVFPRTFVSTREVYRAWRREDTVGLPTGMDGPVTEAMCAAELMGMLSNHLEPAVFRVAPEVAEVDKELELVGAGAWRLSGAGSTFYRLFDEREAAYRVAKRVNERIPAVETAVVAAPVGQPPIVSSNGESGC